MSSDPENDLPPPAQNSEETAGVRGRPFAPGQSGNPSGRPSTKWIRDFLGEVSKTKSGEIARRTALVQALFVTAVDRTHKDHVKAALGLLAYEAGKPVLAVEVTGAEGGPVKTVAQMTSEQQLGRLRELLDKARLPLESGEADASDPTE
jgi:hypothetical protein